MSVNTFLLFESAKRHKVLIYILLEKSHLLLTFEIIYCPRVVSLLKYKTKLYKNFKLSHIRF